MSDPMVFWLANSERGYELVGFLIWRRLYLPTMTSQVTRRLSGWDVELLARKAESFLSTTRVAK